MDGYQSDFGDIIERQVRENFLEYIIVQIQNVQRCGRLP